MLDFDSARYEARVLDLATALHDFAKVFGERGSRDFKVPLYLEVVSGFLGAYLQANPLERAEVEALPVLLAASPLKRAIGKYRSMIEEARLARTREKNGPGGLPGALAGSPRKGVADGAVGHTPGHLLKKGTTNPTREEG